MTNKEMHKEMLKELQGRVEGTIQKTPVTCAYCKARRCGDCPLYFRDVCVHSIKGRNDTVKVKKYRGILEGWIETTENLGAKNEHR